MILEAERLGCVREVIVIAAALSLQDPRERPAEQQAQADQAHARFKDTSSDFLTWLNLWRHLKQQQRELSSSAFRRMCKREFLNYLRVREWQDFESQLRQVCKEMGLELRVLSTALRYHKSGDGAHIWVRKGSPYKTINDLKGKTIATYGLQSTGITLVRLALWKKYGVNVQFENGDFKWQQLPAPALPGALATDKVEAATLIHSQAYQASKSGDFVPVARTAEDMFELFKLRMVSAVNVGAVCVLVTPMDRAPVQAVPALFVA